MGTIFLKIPNKKRKKKYRVLKISNGKLKIKKSIKSNKKLIELLRSKYKISKPRAEKALADFISDIQRNLKKHHLASIHDVAIFSKGKNGVIRIHKFSDYAKLQKKAAKLPKKHLVDSLSLLVPKGPMDKIEKVKKEKEISIVESKESKLESNQVKSTEENSNLDELTVIKPSQQNIHESQEDEVSTTSSVLEKTDLKEVLKDHFYQDDKVQVDTEAQVPEYKSKAISSPSYTEGWNVQFWSKMFFVGLFLVLVGSLLFEHCTGEQSIESEAFELPQDNLLGTAKNEEVIHPEESEEFGKSDNGIEAVYDSQIDEKCKIITGSYKRIKNQNEMIAQIEKLGYELYTEQNGFYTRVGVQFSCGNEDLQAFLQEVRRTLAIDAWYLYPAGII